jgi:ferredoxin
MFGVTPMRTRRQAHKLAQHKAFAEAIVDIFSAVRPCLGIMDAIIGMEGNGPSGGNLKKVSYLFLSEDCVALDAVAAKAVGFEKLDIWTTRVASQRRLGCGEIAKVKIVGDELLPVRFIPPTTLFMNPPSVISRTFYEVTAKKPHFDLNKCSRCRACLKHCPVNAITFEHYPTLHSARCIECFVCAEVCPEGAVNPQNKFLFFLTKLFRRLRTYCPTISRR